MAVFGMDRFLLVLLVVMWTLQQQLHQHTIVHPPSVVIAAAAVAYLPHRRPRTPPPPTTPRSSQHHVRPTTPENGQEQKMPPITNRQQYSGTSKSSSSGSQRRKASDYDHSRDRRRTQLVWVTQSLERTLATMVMDESTDSGYYGQHRPSNQGLVDAMWGLVDARTPEHIRLAGVNLQQALWCSWDKGTSTLTGGPNPTTPPLLRLWPVPVLERVIKAISMTDPPDIIISLAINLTETILDHHGVLPSDIAQEALCSGLRRANMMPQLEQIMGRMRQTALTQQQMPTSSTNGFLQPPPAAAARNVSTVAFNIYLAAVCDDDRTVSGHRYTRPDPERVYWAWIQLQSSRNDAAGGGGGGVQPDAVSYTTLLQAARSIHNKTLSDEVWASLLAHRDTIQPTILAYNARLGCLQDHHHRRRSTLEAVDIESLQLYQELTQEPNAVSPDQYTIDLMLMPLTRAGRLGEVTNLLERFMAGHNSPRAVSAAVEAFLVTLVEGDEIALAKAVFDTYIRPMLSSVVESRVGEFRLVQPTVRHFNILLDGYRSIVRDRRALRQHGANRTCRSSADDDEGTIEKAWDIFRLALQSKRSCRPDAFTLTTMMGLCRSPEELGDLLYLSISQVSIGVHSNSAILRAAMTAWGDLGDPSSSCWMFSGLLTPNSTTPYVIRSWNALLQSMSAAAHRDPTLIVDTATSAAAIRLSTLIQPPHPSLSEEFLKMVDGKTIPEAAKRILDAMMMAGRNDCTHDDLPWPSPTSQTYCTVLSILQLGHDNHATAGTAALALFRSAMASGIQADGRLVNAALRCFGADVDGALSAWKNELRRECWAYEQRPRQVPPSPDRATGKNLIAAYHGLLYVAGRAIRPDVALRLVYAMQREGLVPDETSLNCYRSGKRTTSSRSIDCPKRPDATTTTTTGAPFGLVADQFKLTDAYESVLVVECSQYDQNDRRRASEKRVRIIF